MHRGLAAGAAGLRIIRRRLPPSTGPQAALAAIDRRIEQFRQRRPDRLHVGPRRFRTWRLGFRRLGLRRSRGVLGFLRVGGLGHYTNMVTGTPLVIPARLVLLAVVKNPQSVSVA